VNWGDAVNRVDAVNWVDAVNRVANGTRRGRRNVLHGTVCAAAILAAAIPAVAATAAAGDVDDAASAPAAQLEEITVTAQKRSEDIKDIPISVSAISGAQLIEHHVADYDDISRTVPGISFQAGAGPGLDNIEIRGVSSTSGSATVGIYIDEVSVTVKNTYDGAVQPKLFDLDRIEVLRGPQGTLYGASSMGGTIRFITEQPDLHDFSATVSSDLSVTHHGGFNNDEYAILNVPVIEGEFALRVSVDLAHQSGFIDNYRPTPTGAGPGGSILSLGVDDNTGVLARAGVNDIRTEVVRISGKYAGPDDLTITPALFWQRTAVNDSNLQYPAIGLYDQDKRVAEPGTDTLTVPSLTVNKSFGWADLTSITSYFKRDFNRVTDGTYYNSNVFANFFVAQPTDTAPQAYGTATVLAFLPSPVYYRTRTEQFSQELRLSSKDAALAGIPATWTAGLYFSDQHQTHLDDEFIPGLQADFLNIYGYGIGSNASPVGAANYPGVSYANDSIYFGHSFPTEQQLAPFGEFGLQVTPQLKAALGLRYVAAKESNHVVSGGFYSFGLPVSYSDSERFHATTPKVSLDYAINDSSNVYVTAAKGFRLGGPTGPDPANVPGGTCDADYASLNLANPPTQYQSDSLWSYELGSKGRYADNRVSVNAAAYAINWSNIQQTINLPTCGFGFTTNVGNAKIYGSEFELRALVLPSLTLSLNAGTTHAYITSVSSLGSGIVSVGESILNVPKYSITPSADYDTSISDSTTGFVRVDFPYTGRSRAYFDSSGLTHLYSPGYGIVNLNLGFTHDKLTVGLYAKNLLNWKGIIQYPSVNSVPEGYTVRPLTMGVMATFQM
jgi:outer membrane receptor protein involved in Fe transport